MSASCVCDINKLNISNVKKYNINNIPLRKIKLMFSKIGSNVPDYDDFDCEFDDEF